MNHHSNGRRIAAAKFLSMPTSILLVWLVPLAMARSAYPEGEEDSRHSGEVRIRTLSSRPYLVSGGDALVQIDLSRHVSLDDLRVTLNGSDVTSVFHADSSGHALKGLVEGLRIGRNLLQVLGRHHRLLAALRLTNYPITGPIVSGPHLQPFICQTESFMLPDGSTLGPPLDADCSASTRINYVYMSTAGGPFRPLPSLTELPADVSITTTLDGITAPFVVRVETGTMNRGIYQNAILHDPTSDPPPSPFSPPGGWNKR